jgi:hypothetical protein
MFQDLAPYFIRGVWSSSAILGGAAAENVLFTGNFVAQRRKFPVQHFVMKFL